MTLLFEGFCEQDEAMTTEFWELFFPRLVGLARRVLSESLDPPIDAEDVAQTAFVKFWKQAVAGGVDALSDRNRIWSALASITVQQAITHIRKAKAWKRGGRHKTFSLEGEADSDRTIGQLSYHEFDMILEELLNALPTRDRAILICKMMGSTDAEIASVLECSERQIRRRMKAIRELWVQDF